jgi:hypothetical protein
LETVADRLHEARSRAEATGEALSKIEKRVAPHFLGAVVLDQLPAPAGGDRPACGDRRTAAADLAISRSALGSLRWAHDSARCVGRAAAAAPR